MDIIDIKEWEEYYRKKDRLPAQTGVNAIAIILTSIYPLFLTVVANLLSYGDIMSLMELIVENTGAFLSGLLFSYAFFGIICLIVRYFALAALIEGALFIVLPLVDYFKYNILNEHFLPSDLFMVDNIKGFEAFMTDIKITPIMIICIVFTLIYIILIAFSRAKMPSDVLVTSIMALGSVFLALVILIGGNMGFSIDRLLKSGSSSISNQNGYYDVSGFVTAFIWNFGTNNNMKVSESQNERLQNYMSKANQEKVKIDKESKKEDVFKNPDVIVVLSESFWNPTNLYGVEFSEEPLKNFREISSKNPSGTIISTSFGGGTSRPEFEVLTGMTTHFMPTGVQPYKQYVKNDTYSFARYFKDMGYDTVGIHTYHRTFYSRNNAYEYMGFDDFRGMSDLNTKPIYDNGPYIKDETLINEIIYELENSHENGVFISAISMENHSLYKDKYPSEDIDIHVSSDKLTPESINIIENFTKGVSEADKALKKLYDYVMSRDKETVVLWYGDHLPSLGDNLSPYTDLGIISSPDATKWTDDETAFMFSTPFVMFSNYDTKIEPKGDGAVVSPYMLMDFVCEYIGAPKNEQLLLLDEIFKVVPVYNNKYDYYIVNTNMGDAKKLIEILWSLTCKQLGAEGGDE